MPNKLFPGIITKTNPTHQDVHVDVPLTNVSIAYLQSTDEYVADQVFPRVPVQKQSDQWYIYNKGDWFRPEATVRPPSTESAGGGYRLSTDTYNCEVYAWHQDVDDRVMANYDSPLEPRRDATEWVMQTMLISRDVDFANAYFTTGVWGESGGDNDLTAGVEFVQWSEPVNSDPIGDISSYKRAVKLATGRKANGLLINGPVYDTLVQHPDIIERIKYTQSALNIGPSLVANALGVDRLIVAEGIQNTGAEGATVNMSGIFGNHALLFYAPPRPSLLTPSAGYTFAWTGYGGQNAYGVTMDAWYERKVKSTRVEGEMAYDMKVVAGEMAYFFEDVIA